MKKLMILAALLMGATAFGKTLEGTAEGYNGPIKVAVTMDGDKITKVEVAEHTETKRIFKTTEPVLTALVGKTSVEGVDVVAGATYSSEGILNAVKDALSKNK